jgi:hypothetical protein
LQDEKNGASEDRLRIAFPVSRGLYSQEFFLPFTGGKGPDCGPDARSGKSGQTEHYRKFHPERREYGKSG